LNYTQVLVDNMPAPLLYVDTGQINFLIPAKQSTGAAKLQVFREGLYGPVVTLAIVDGAPALFSTPGGYAIATHADASLITPDAPAHREEVIVLYLTGLGKTQPNMDTGQIPSAAATIVHLADLKLWLAGTPVDASLIKYAGLTPGSAGLYQINLYLPDQTPNDPEVRVSMENQTSKPGLKLALR
jgi:uncharacterized protein (TIGR03437 family)